MSSSTILSSSSSSSPAASSCNPVSGSGKSYVSGNAAELKRLSELYWARHGCRTAGESSNVFRARWSADYWARAAEEELPLRRQVCVMEAEKLCTSAPVEEEEEEKEAEAEAGQAEEDLACEQESVWPSAEEFYAAARKAADEKRETIRSAVAPASEHAGKDVPGTYISQHAQELAELSDKWFQQQADGDIPFEFGYNTLLNGWILDEWKVEEDALYLVASYSAWRVEAVRRERVMYEARVAAMGWEGQMTQEVVLMDVDEFEEEEEEQCEDTSDVEGFVDFVAPEEDAMDVDECNLLSEEQVEEELSDVEEEVFFEAVGELVEREEEEVEEVVHAQVVIEQLTVGFQVEQMLAEMVTELAQEKEEQAQGGEEVLVSWPVERVQVRVEEVPVPVPWPPEEGQVPEALQAEEMQHEVTMERGRAEMQAKKMEEEDYVTLRRSGRQRKPAQPRAAPYQSLRTLG